MYKTKKSILVIDDEINITEVIKSYLEFEGFSVFTAYTGEEAIEIFDKINPNLVILDLMLPGISGEEVCNNFRTKSRVPIIMLTAKTKEEDFLNGLEIGADDYVTKPFSLKKLTAKVKVMLRRSDNDPVPLSDMICFNNGELTINDNNYEVKKHGKIIDLTPVEYNILISMVKYPSKIFTREEFIDTISVSGDSPQRVVRTIDSHVKNLRHKIEDDPKNPKYIITVHGTGYKLGIG
jgi:DNA-binding response OmpR family regulator